MFDFIMPLGWFCGTTSSMSKYGLREMSGPFDWNFSKLRGVLHFLEDDFIDFLALGNLEVLEDDPRRFRDKEWGVLFVHEVNSNFYEEYASIVEKQFNRIMRVEEQLEKGRVCFLRAVKDQSEIDYILQNHEYIRKVIRMKNCENEIIFVIPKFINVPDGFPFLYAPIGINVYQGNYREGLRALFDTNMEFVHYLEANYSPEQIAKNKEFDKKKELDANASDLSRPVLEWQAIADVDAAYQNYRIAESKCKSLIHIVKHDFKQIPDPLIIYHADEVGKIIYDKIKEKTHVLAFLEDDSSEGSYEGIPIRKVEDYSFEEKSTIIFAWDYESEIIKYVLTNRLKEKVEFVKLEEILNIQ